MLKELNELSRPNAMSNIAQKRKEEEEILHNLKILKNKYQIKIFVA